MGWHAGKTLKEMSLKLSLMINSMQLGTILTPPMEKVPLIKRTLTLGLDKWLVKTAFQTSLAVESNQKVIPNKKKNLRLKRVLLQRLKKVLQRPKKKKLKQLDQFG